MVSAMTGQKLNQNIVKDGFMVNAGVNLLWINEFRYFNSKEAL